MGTPIGMIVPLSLGVLHALCGSLRPDRPGVGGTLRRYRGTRREAWRCAATSAGNAPNRQRFNRRRKPLRRRPRSKSPTYLVAGCHSKSTVLSGAKGNSGLWLLETWAYSPDWAVASPRAPFRTLDRLRVGSRMTPRNRAGSGCSLSGGLFPGDVLQAELTAGQFLALLARDRHQPQLLRA